MRAISISAWRRPDYFKQVLDSLKKCHGIEDYILYIGIDGKGDERVVEMARAIDFVPVQMLLNNRHLGCNQCTKHIQMYAFKHFDYVVHLEDDTPLAPDALRYFQWAEQFVQDLSIFSVSAWGVQPREAENHNDNARVVKKQWFSCWAWATWQDRWREMQHEWTTGSDSDKSWDIRVDEVRGPRYQIQPIVSRSNNIGEHLGTHRGACHVGDWAGSPGFASPTEYQKDWT